MFYRDYLEVTWPEQVNKKDLPDAQKKRWVDRMKKLKTVYEYPAGMQTDGVSCGIFVILFAIWRTCNQGGLFPIEVRLFSTFFFLSSLKVSFFSSLEQSYKSIQRIYCIYIKKQWAWLCRASTTAYRKHGYLIFLKKLSFICRKE